MKKCAKKSAPRVFAVLMSFIICLSALVMPISAAAQTSNRDQIFNFIVDKIGLSPAAACGILTNMYCESKYDPTVGSSDSFGLCQWTGARFTNLKNYCSKNGYNYKTIDGQMNFLKSEFEGSEWSAFAKMKAVENSAEGAYKAAYDFCRYYERGGGTSTWDSRGNYAKNTLWPIYGANEPGSDSTDDTSDEISPDLYPIPKRTLTYVKGSVMTGDDVRFVQAVLLKLGYDIEIDGSFGPASKAVVTQFQKDNGLTANGSVDSKTLDKLISLWNAKKSSKGDINQDGTVDEKDSVMLGRYLAGWDVTINQSNSDINKDNTIDEKDAIILSRYLAGWNIELGN